MPIGPELPPPTTECAVYSPGYYHTCDVTSQVLHTAHLDPTVHAS